MLKPKSSKQNLVCRANFPWRWTLSSLVGIASSKGRRLLVIKRSSNILQLLFLGHAIYLIQYKYITCQYFCSGLFLSKLRYESSTHTSKELSSSIFQCLSVIESVREASVTPDQLSTFPIV